VEIVCSRPCRASRASLPARPKRARRAVELVAYLALHAPSPSRATASLAGLGTAETDAAARPCSTRRERPGRRSGRTPTAWRSCGASKAGSTHRLPHQRGRRPCEVLFAAAAHRRAPRRQWRSVGGARAHRGRAALDGALGLCWWRAEGTRPGWPRSWSTGRAPWPRWRGGGNFVLARWALEQARLVDPYSEALTRSAMTLAALAEDPTAAPGVERVPAAHDELDRVATRASRPSSSSASCPEGRTRRRAESGQLAAMTMRPAARGRRHRCAVTVGRRRWAS